MNETLELTVEYEVSFEEASRLEDEPLEIACENKLGYIALCASCPLVAMFGECPKEIRNDIATPEFDSDELFNVDFMVDSGVDFGVQIQSEVIEVSQPSFELPDESIAQVAAPIVVSEKPALKPQNNRAVEQVVKPKTVPEKPVARSYLELLLDDSISMVVAPVFQPRKKEVVKQKSVTSPIQQVPQSPIASKKEERPFTVTKKPADVLPVVHEQTIEEVVVSEPSPTTFVVEPPKKRPEAIKSVVVHKKPVVKPVSVARQINPPQQKIAPAVIPRPTKLVNTIKPVAVTLTASEISKPSVPAPAMSLAKDYDNKPALETVTVSQPVEEMAEIEVETPAQIITDAAEPLQENQDPEIELPITVVDTDEDVRVKPLFLEEQFVEMDDRQDYIIVPDTPEVLIENTAQPVSSMLRNIKLLLGSFVLKITL